MSANKFETRTKPFVVRKSENPQRNLNRDCETHPIPSRFLHYTKAFFYVKLIFQKSSQPSHS